MKNTTILTATIIAMLIVPANANHKNRGVQDEATKTECGACHMVFQPGFLPAGSWTAIMSDLGNHFGEDASLDEASRTSILTYLVDNARKKEFRTKDGKPPLRITKLNWFVGEHRRNFSKKLMEKVGTLSNCVACHRGAERGQYDDD